MRIFITTLGCPKNVVDSEMMAELLMQAGHRLVDQPQRADVLIANTCGFVAAAREESLQALDELARGKSRRQVLVAAGCMAQRYADIIREAVPQVDAVIGTRSWPEIVQLVQRLGQRERGIELREERAQLVTSVRRNATMGASAYVKIADGCDAACAFCAIPLIKGPQRSKPQADIQREALELEAQGVRELVLIAQDSTAYGRDLGHNDALPALLRELASQTPQIQWLRLMYAYPQHVSEALIAAIAELPAVCHYLDLPLQHGHPEVLRRMHRPHDLDTVYRLIERLRATLPDIALRSTFIVGFPGETEAEFEGLLAFLDEVRFDKVGVFAYSAEDGTPAAAMPDHVPAEIIAERYDRAMTLQQEISYARNRAQIGRVLPVLIDGSGDGLSVGRSYREAPEIDGLVLIPGEYEAGTFVEVQITEAQPYDLVAEPLN